MKWFKTVTTVRYSRGVKELGWAPYDCRLWHRNYYEHIIRNDVELDLIRDYIAANPARWSERNNPS
jgi:REP element-mobilizing transposase RayT